MLSNIENTIFVIVPPEYVSELASPSFIPALTKIKDDDYYLPGINEERTEEIKKASIVLILEDADKCLVPRGADNINSIASILNFSDGILGSILDIKIIASTNAKSKEIDPAIVRPGRLCCMVNIDALQYEKANKIYQQLRENTEVSLPEEKSYTLAEIYELALGEKPEEVVERKMGF